MSDSIVRLLLEQYLPDLLDIVERATRARQVSTELPDLQNAAEAQLTAALRRAYEMGYREALAARAKAEAAKATVSVLVDESVGFAAAPPAQAPAVEGRRDEAAEKVIAEMRALVTNWGDASKVAETSSKGPKADLSMFGEPLPEEPDDRDEDPSDVSGAPAVSSEDDEEEAPSIQLDSPVSEEGADDGIADEDDEEEHPEIGEKTSKPRIRRTNAEIAASAEHVLAYIKEHPGTKARAARDALGLENTDWQRATKSLAKAGRIFYAGATKARVYFALAETKRGKPKKLTKSAFILALPVDMPAAEVVAAGQGIGLEFDDRYVHAIRSFERRRLRTEAAAERTGVIARCSAAVAANPRDPEGYRELRKAYTQARRTDAIWATCQALVTLGAAEDSEQAFFEARRSEKAAHAHAALDPDLRARHVVHDAVDPRVTTVVDYVLPALLERYGRPTVAQGYTDAHRIDPSRHSVLSQTLVYAARVLGVELPPIYLHSTAPITIFSIHGDQPTIGLGAEAVDLTDARVAAFVAANHLSYFLPGHYARRLVPQESELRRWVEATIALSRGATQFEHLSHLEQIMLQTQVDPDERKIIVKATEGLEEQAIDLAGWLRGVDATADRLGLLLCHDLEWTIGILRGGEATGDDATEARIDALRIWSVSEDYLAVRAALGIAVE
ncbi:MAG: hypothetical protein U0271_07085 [Polyangiaceae bacterium]